MGFDDPTASVTTLTSSSCAEQCGHLTDGVAMIQSECLQTPKSGCHGVSVCRAVFFFFRSFHPFLGVTTPSACRPAGLCFVAPALEEGAVEGGRRTGPRCPAVREHRVPTKLVQMPPAREITPLRLFPQLEDTCC